MLTKTTAVGLQALLYLAQRKTREPVSPRRLALGLEQSPSYLAKVTAQLVRANLLVAHHGVKGGVTLSRPPEDILLLDVVQALQGMLTPDHCPVRLPARNLCGFHKAMLDVHVATRNALARWNLADMAVGHRGRKAGKRAHICVMTPVDEALDVTRTGRRPA